MVSLFVIYGYHNRCLYRKSVTDKVLNCICNCVLQEKENNGQVEEVIEPCNDMFYENEEINLILEEYATPFILTAIKLDEIGTLN